jgi:hypothetical protein
MGSVRKRIVRAVQNTHLTRVLHYPPNARGRKKLRLGWACAAAIQAGLSKPVTAGRDVTAP